MCTTNMNLLRLYTLSRWKNMFTGGIFTNITHKLSTLTDDMLLILPTWVYSFFLLFFNCSLLLFHFICYCFAVCSSFLFVLIVIANWFFVVLYCYLTHIKVKELQQTRIYDKHCSVNSKHDEREVQPRIPKKSHKRKQFEINNVVTRFQKNYC